MSPAMKVIIVIFAVILVLSLCLPFFSSCSFGGSTAETGDDAVEEVAEVTETTVASVDAQYATVISELDSRLAEDPESLVALANLGNNYMEWGSALQGASDAADNEEHVHEVFEKAVGYYDRYLALNDSKAVTVNRAICEYYAGSEDLAIADLEEFVASDDTFSPAWVNLGQFYESAGRIDEARAAYNSALEAEIVDSYNMAYYAQLRLYILDAIEQAASSVADSSADSDSAASSEADDAQAASLTQDASAASDEDGEIR